MYFETVLDKYSDSTLRFEALLGLAKCDFALGNEDDADRELNEILMLSKDEKLKDQARKILDSEKGSDGKDRDTGGDI